MYRFIYGEDNNAVDDNNSDDEDNIHMRVGLVQTMFSSPDLA
jgi:hypothetical protein